MTPQNVLDFWFKEIDRKYWFANNPQFDNDLTTRFRTVYQKAFNGELSEWRNSPSGRLAEIIVLDQFGRNMFRGTPQAFQGDSLALRLAREAVEVGDDKRLPIEQRAFIYMPFMHSEDLKAHEDAVQLFSQKGLEENLKFEIRHKNIIDRFGRYPHRNQALGRQSTPEELEFLKQKGSSF
jgi:uncharacterized protein (DUF924 family)